MMPIKVLGKMKKADAVRREVTYRAPALVPHIHLQAKQNLSNQNR